MEEERISEKLAQEEAEVPLISWLAMNFLVVNGFQGILKPENTKNIFDGKNPGFW